MIDDLIKYIRDHGKKKPIIEEFTNSFEKYSFPYEPKKVFANIDIAEVNEIAYQKVKSKGFKYLRKAQIKAFSEVEEEQGEAYIKHENGKWVIHISKKYLDPENPLKAEYWDNIFMFSHEESLSFNSVFTNDPVLRIRHIIEDILVHEYCHEAYGENFKGLILKHFYDKGRNIEDNKIKLILGRLYSHAVDEAFARWLTNIIQGHKHNDEVDILPSMSKQYSDRTLEIYNYLNSLTEAQGEKYVRTNLAGLMIRYYEICEFEKYEKLKIMFDYEKIKNREE